MTAADRIAAKQALEQIAATIEAQRAAEQPKKGAK